MLPIEIHAKTKHCFSFSFFAKTRNNSTDIFTVVRYTQGLLCQKRLAHRTWSLFACNLGVEAAEADGERLESRYRILIVHGEDVLPDLPELENNILLLLLPATSVLEGCNELEVLH